MPNITIENGSTFEAANEKRLVLALEDSGLDILHRCGGYAKCTTCRVQFRTGEPDAMTTAERDRLAESGLVGQYRLSCQIYCDHDMTLKWVNRLSQSEYDDTGNRPKDQITPDAVWTTRPR